MSCWCFYSAVLLLILLGFTSSESFDEENSDTETILIDDVDFKSFGDLTYDQKLSENVRTKRATDYSSEAYEDEEEEAPAGSGSEATYEDEVSLLSRQISNQETKSESF